MVKKYIITGGPCTGKTTTVKALSKEGYQIIPEAAKIVIDDQQAKKGKLLPWIDRNGFQKEVMEKQIELDSQIKGEIIFIDRGIPDGIAYYKLDKLNAPEEILKKAKSYRYDKIFLLERLPNYEIDSVRKEDLETAKKIDKLMKETYEELGYKVILVPPFTIKERIDFIKKYI